MFFQYKRNAKNIKSFKTKKIKKTNVLLLIIFVTLFKIIILMISMNVIFIFHKRKLLNKNKKKKKIFSNKWFVITTINSPNSLIDSLMKIDGWAIVVIGDKKTNDDNWKQFDNSTKLIYLSIESQLYLNFRTTKHIQYNSYSRKTIGYLYAIKNGAKEIFEINDDIISDFADLKLHYNETIFDRLSMCDNNNSRMINPYYYFAVNDIWPRGFRLKDINNQGNHKLFNLASSQVLLRPLVFQGIINGEPDIDSLFILTRIKKNKPFEIKFIRQYPLLYLPRNYVPINSKNTKYLYDIFPTLALPTTINQKISDIIRGFIMQNYAWRINGSIVYVSSNAYKISTSHYNQSSLDDEKDLFYKIDEILNVLNNTNFEYNDPIIYIMKLIEALVSSKLLGKKDLKLYQDFLKDLSDFGFVFPKNLLKKSDFNYDNYFTSNIKLNIRPLLYQTILLENNMNNQLKLYKHRYSYKVYNDILLAINYNYDFLVNLNDYLIDLYSKFFPYIVFISPGNLSSNNIISCPESKRGYFVYMCFRKVYERFPNFKGYLFLNDDNFLKPWEIENMDFNVPITNFFTFFSLNRLSGHKKLQKMIDNNQDWKDKVSNYVGYPFSPKIMVDFLYIPKSIINKFCGIVEKMYEERIFIEIGIPTAFALLSLNEYEIINSILILGRSRKYKLKYLKNSKDFTCVHPIKASKLLMKEKEEISSYIYFVNALDY